MNCKNCGAPMVLNRERDYYRCEYCGAFYFPSASTEGMRTLGENPEGIRCPICHVPLQMVVLDDHYRGYHCARCRGFLFFRSTFRHLLESRRARAATPSEPPTRYDPGELQRRISCPMCSRVMETYPYLGPGNIVIDTCSWCDLIWLDYREIEKAVNAPGRDRGIRQPKGDDGFRSWGKRRRKKGLDILRLLDDFPDLD